MKHLLDQINSFSDVTYLELGIGIAIVISIVAFIVYSNKKLLRGL